MKSRNSLLVTLWRRIFPKRQESTPVRLSPEEKRAATRAARDLDRGIEPLEGRIAPAVLLPGGRELTYQDADGDLVTLHLSKSLFSKNATQANITLQNVFTFSAGKAHTGDANQTDDVPQFLQRIDLSGLLIGSHSIASGLSISITAQQSGNGDGLVNVGAINANNISIGSVLVDGDLGQIDAGSNTNVYGVKSLTVNSLGKLTSTQLGTGTYESRIVGGLHSFNADSIDGGYLHVVNGFAFQGKSLAQGKIDMVKIAGHIKARDLTAPGTNDGVIQTEAGIGSIRVGSNAVNTDFPAFSDGLTGGVSENSGSIISGGKIGDVSILGSIRGGVGTSSGSIVAKGSIGRLTVSEGIVGSVGNGAGAVHADGNILSASIGGTGGSGLVGGTGTGGGVVSSGGAIGAVQVSKIIGSGIDSGGVSAQGKIASVKIFGYVQGGDKVHSGFIQSEREIGNVRIDGSLLGGSEIRSGTIISGGKIGDVTVHGSIHGGSGAASGAVFSGIAGVGDIGKVRIDQGLLGGSADSSGVVSAVGNIGSVTIARTPSIVGNSGAIEGGTGDSSGAVYAFGTIGSVDVLGDMLGGAGEHSGNIGAHGLLKRVNITGDLRGAEGAGSGSIAVLDAVNGSTPGRLGSVVVGGDVIGSSGLDAGTISSDGGIGSIRLGALLGGSEPQSGRIVAGAGLLGPGNIASVIIADLGRETTSSSNPLPARGGTLLAFGTVGSITLGHIQDGTIHVADSIGSLLVNGDVFGGIVTAGGQAVFNGKTDLAIASIIVRGDVESSSIMAGYSVTGAAATGHAQIGAVRVTGDWIASNLVAGVKSSAGNFGTAANTLIDNSSTTVISKIASIVINGDVLGSSNANDHFGFVAQQIGSFEFSGGKFALSSTPGQSFEVTSTTTNDVTVREVTAV